MSPAWIEAGAAVVAAVVAIIAVLVTASQVRTSARASALDSEDRTRPQLGMRIEPGLWGPGSADLVVENFGRATAKAVRIGLKAGLPRVADPDDTILAALRGGLSTPFDLAPGARRRVFWRMKYPDSGGRRHGAPETGTVVASYRWEPARGGEPRSYSDSYDFDLESLLALNPNPSRGATRKGDEHHVEHNLMTVLRMLAANVASLRR